ncbi:luciferase-like monooxygenase family protein [Paraburkholderia fungorum]|uniref:Luciferase-like monooxygenase family protein n=2 Tax=Paraburkholderia fungorum TaxID=134537 RepID=A0AAU8T1A2_9BURK|nr:luciferase-like monooxygenase family protein [Paraburkholderia fungorum]
MTLSKLPERWVPSWQNNLKLGQMLDEADIDFMLPIARWIGYGGESDFQGSILETATWATALLASTKRITVFSTIHTAVFHPVVVAKQLATMAQVSGDRVGLNIVAGWNKPEYLALGLNLPDDQETRYAYAQEWFDIVKKLWAHEGPFDWEGKYFQLQRVYGNPKPAVMPPIFNAAGSGQGREFASRNANVLFTPAIDLTRSKNEVAELKATAQHNNYRKVEVMTFSHVVCCPTEAEAKARVQHILDNADWVGVDNLMRLLFTHTLAFPHDLLAKIREGVALGHGGFPLVGTPEQVADGMCALHAAGFRGTTLSFFDYTAEFPYFRDKVLPILQTRGIR